MNNEQKHINIEAERLALALVGAGHNVDQPGIESVLSDVTSDNIVYVLAALARHVVHALVAPDDTPLEDFLALRLALIAHAESELPRREQ